MEQYFVKDYTGPAFQLFGTGHLAALLTVLAANLLIFSNRKKFFSSKGLYFRRSLAVLLLVNEAAWHVWNFWIGEWTIQTMLPFQLCSVFVFLSAVMLLTRSYRVYEFAYFLGFGGALQALITPDAGMYGLPHFRAVQTLVAHGSIVTAALYMTFVEGYRPTVMSMKRVLVVGNLYMAAVFILNQLIGSNYLFIAHKPETASLIDVLGPWPWYILSLEAVALLMMLTLYLPFAILDWQRQKKLLFG